MNITGFPAFKVRSIGNMDIVIFDFNTAKFVGLSCYDNAVESGFF